MLFGILPFLFFILCAGVVFSHRREKREGVDVRVVLLTASVISAVWMVAGTELLSPFGAIRFGPVLLWWLVPMIAMGCVLVLRRERPCAVHWEAPRLDATDLSMLAAIGFLAITAGISAFFSAPNNYDSLEYHLPRQIYWIQNQSVAHYPPHLFLQIAMPPFSEFMSMHMMVLSGGDRWANLVQWFSLIMALLAVSLIARDLGAGRKGQLLAALLVAAAPPVYLFASNTKNDLVLALWVCLLAWWAVRIFIDRDCGPVRSALVGATLGLALLTKGTSYLFAAPVCFFMGIGIIRSTRRFARPALIITACAVLIMLGHWVRNYQVYGSALVVEKKLGDIHQVFTPAATVSNILRNLTLHAGLPSDAYNAGLERLVNDLHSRLGIDPQDRRITFRDKQYEVRYDPHNEDRASAGAHVVLIGLTLLSAPFFRKRLRGKLFFGYMIVPVTGFILFCIFLKWTPWHSRLHIPLLCLFVPPMAVMLTRTPLKFILPVAMVGVFAAWAPTFMDNQRPLLGERSIFKSDRITQMFIARPHLKEATVAVVDRVNELRPETVAFHLGRREWEYPLQRLILDGVNEPPVFSSFDARLSGEWDGLGDPPDVVVSIRHHRLELRDELSGSLYDMVAHHAPYSVYARRDLTVGTEALGLLAPFLGWDAVSGLRPPEGPYPDWNLPIVRWGLGPRTEMYFEGGGEQLVLSMVCGPWHLAWQEVSILLNGEQIGHRRFDTQFEFVKIRIPMHPRAGRNSLTLRYQTWDDTDPQHPLALLFKSLRILPPRYDSPL